MLVRSVSLDLEIDFVYDTNQQATKYANEVGALRNRSPLGIAPRCANASSFERRPIPFHLARGLNP